MVNSKEASDRDPEEKQALIPFCTGDDDDHYYYAAVVDASSAS